MPQDPLPPHLEPHQVIEVAPYSYRLRRYAQRGHGWIRDDPRAEVGMEAKILVDEVARLRHELDGATDGSDLVRVVREYLIEMENPMPDPAYRMSLRQQLGELVDYRYDPVRRERR